MTLVEWLQWAASDTSRVRWHTAFGVLWALLAFAQSFLLLAGGLLVGGYAALAIAHFALALRDWRRLKAQGSGES